MIIDGNETEKHAMQEFHKGNRAEGLRIQEEFASAFRTEYADKDHCPCQKACRYHGNCKECVAMITGTSGACTELHASDDQCQIAHPFRTDRAYDRQ